MWKISPLLLPSLCFGTAFRALVGKALPGKDSSILCCFVIRTGLRIQAQLLHHRDLMTFSKTECFELLWFQEQGEQWFIKSSVFNIRNKVRGMLQKARKTARNIDWKSLQVLGSISSSQCPGKMLNFLITFFFYQSVAWNSFCIILVFPVFIRSADCAISDQILMLKNLCPLVWRCNTQGEVLGQKWTYPCPPVPAAELPCGASGSWAACPVVRHASMPGRTGKFLALKMNQNSGSTGISPLRIKSGGFCLFFLASSPHPRLTLNHSQCNTLYRSLMQVFNWSGLENSVIRLKLTKLQI